ncbi:MAG: stealth conserved region 3 domain-containing protein, partial [Myxococcota bacterium]
FDRLYEPDTGRVDLRRLHRHPIDGVCDFDVDFVYTWVNHADPEWRRLIGEHRPLDSVDWDRYHAADELRYSLRSVHHFAPWARTIHVVTNCAEPPWLRPHPQIRWVTHEEVFPSGADYLPTFNSHAIESCLMRIEGLSEHFVYLNDDVFLGGPASPLDFFAANGTSVSYLEPYGMVLGTPDPEKPDYLNAALNGKRLIEETFGVSPTRLHEHVPYALKRSVLSEIEGRFAADFDRVRRARFRTMDDISVVSFLYHQYAFQTRHALRAPAANAILIRPANSASAFVELLSGRRRQFFCINDGGDSAADASYAARSTRFLARFFPEPAPWEASSSS